MGLSSPSRPDRPRLYLSVPRDANTHLLEAAVSQLPGCDEVAVGEVASKGQLSASFEHSSSARSAADAIAADRKVCRRTFEHLIPQCEVTQLAGISVKLISGDSSPDGSPPLPYPSNISRPDSALQLPDTLYEGSPAPLELNSHASYASQQSPGSLQHTFGDPLSCGDHGLLGSSAATLGVGNYSQSQMRGNTTGWSPSRAPAPLQVEQRSASTSSMPEGYDNAVAAQLLAARLKKFAIFQDDSLRDASGPYSVQTLLNQSHSPRHGNRPQPPGNNSNSARNGAIRGLPPQGMWPRSAGQVPTPHATAQTPCSGGPHHAPRSAGYAEASAHLHSQGSFDRSPGRPVSVEEHRGPAVPELSRQRLYVVVSKSATEDQIAKLFKRFGGMEYCNLKRDKKTGQSKGFCFVNFSTPESAELAKKSLNGMEFPPGSGKLLKVLYSEVLKTSTARSTWQAPAPPPPAPPMFHDQRPDSLRGMAAGGNRGVFSSSIPGPREQASLSPSRAMPTVLSASSYRPSSGHSSGMLPPPQPPLAQRLSTDTISPGIGGNLLPLRHQDLHALFADPAVLVMHIQRPLPTYALTHEFEQFGKVVFLQLHDDDGCFAVVKFEQNGNYPPAQYPTSMYPSSMGPPSSHGLSSTGSRHSGSILNPPHSPSSHFTEAPIRRHTYMPPQQQVPAPPPLQHSYRDQPTQFTPPFWSNQQGY